MKDNMIPLLIHFPGATIDALDCIVAMTGESRSAVVRRGVNALVKGDLRETIMVTVPPQLHLTLIRCAASRVQTLQKIVTSALRGAECRIEGDTVLVLPDAFEEGLFRRVASNNGLCVEDWVLAVLEHAVEEHAVRL